MQLLNFLKFVFDIFLLDLVLHLFDQFCLVLVKNTITKKVEKEQEVRAVNEVDH